VVTKRVGEKQRVSSVSWFSVINMGGRNLKGTQLTSGLQIFANSLFCILAICAVLLLACAAHASDEANKTATGTSIFGKEFFKVGYNNYLFSAQRNFYFRPRF
jgi:hypothetical protein